MTGIEKKKKNEAKGEASVGRAFPGREVSSCFFYKHLCLDDRTQRPG